MLLKVGDGGGDREPGAGARDVLAAAAAVRHGGRADAGDGEHVHRGRQDEGGRRADVDLARQDPLPPPRPDEQDRGGPRQGAPLVSTLIMFYKRQPIIRGTFSD